VQHGQEGLCSTPPVSTVCQDRSKREVCLFVSKRFLSENLLDYRDFLLDDKFCSVLDDTSLLYALRAVPLPSLVNPEFTIKTPVLSLKCYSISTLIRQKDKSIFINMIYFPHIYLHNTFPLNVNVYVRIRNRYKYR